MGAERALDWYAEVLGGHILGDPIVMADGRISHAEIVLPGGDHLMLSEQHPEIGVTAPGSEGGSNVTLHLEVSDVDAVMLRSLESGASLERAAIDKSHRRNGVVRDPFGHRWMFSGPAGDDRPSHGDIGYVSLWVGDADRAADFFEATLGWRYADTSRGFPTK